MTPMTIDGIEIAVNIQDMVTHNRISVWIGEFLIGHKDLPIRVGTEIRILEYTAKSILRGHHVEATNA